jgi:hypothetical protein
MESVYVGSKAQNFAHKRVVLTIESSLPKNLAIPKKPASFSIFLNIILNPVITYSILVIILTSLVYGHLQLIQISFHGVNARIHPDKNIDIRSFDNK